MPVCQTKSYAALPYYEVQEGEMSRELMDPELKDEEGQVISAAGTNYRYGAARGAQVSAAALTHRRLPCCRLCVHRHLLGARMLRQ